MCFRRIVSLCVGRRRLRRQGSNQAVAPLVRSRPTFGKLESWLTSMYKDSWSENVVISVVINGWPATSARTDRSWLTWSTCLSLITVSWLEADGHHSQIRLTINFPQYLERIYFVFVLFCWFRQAHKPDPCKSTCCQSVYLLHLHRIGGIASWAYLSLTS